MNRSLGLKGCMKDYEGGSLRFKVEHILDELKYAWQRVWNGYDSRDVWALSDRTIDRFIVLLQDYKENCHCLWWCPDGYDWNKVCEYDELACRYVFSKKQMDIIIDTLIFHLQMSDEDFVEKKLYGNNIYDDDYVAKDLKTHKRIWTIRKQNQDIALNLLKLLWDELWD